MNYAFCYIIELQYLGFRYHGWFHQPDVKTVQFMVDKTLTFILKQQKFKTLGASRTDAKVSANHMVFELFLKDELPNLDDFLNVFNQNLPNDIRATKINQTTANFNILQTPKKKEYIYLFAFGEKPHPFSAPLITTFLEDLDLELMKKGALLFQGKHNFKKYCTKPSQHTQFEREILLSTIQDNDLYQANFFPKQTFAFHVHSKGFLRYQVRLMMGQLVRLGRHEITLNELKESLSYNDQDHSKIPYIAPASGLILNKTEIDF